MNLYLIRHAIAVEEAEGIEDAARPLTDKGIKKMRSIAKGLRKMDAEFDLILSSPYIRAKETAEILADVFKMKKNIAYSDNLVPMGDPDLLISEINEKYSVGSIALVGHEPHLSNLTGFLVSENAKADVAYKKGGVSLLAADDLRHARSATLELLLTPKFLIALGEK